jgi:peptidoglycan/xylan/chitin deacetylase (PgdA/CDA1 family)
MGKHERMMIPILRWGIKKTARVGVALGSCATGRLVEPGTSEYPEIRVLTYHRFGTIPRDPYCISPVDFRGQIAYLAERGIAICLGELEESIFRGTSPRLGAVLVTIDDGFRSTYSSALPILRDYAVPAVVFVTPSLIRQFGVTSMVSRPDYAPEDYMDWKELEQLARANIDIGSHSWTHRSLGRMSAAQVEDEVVRSREMLEQRLCEQVTAFAYPFGTRADFNTRTASILKRAGYRCAFTSQHGTVHAGIEPFLLPRIKVESGEGLWLFKLLLRGGLDAWSWVDRTLWRVQASGRE